MKTILLLLVLLFGAFAFDLPSPLPEGVRGCRYNQTYLTNTTWEDHPFETPLDTISLGKFGSLVLVKSDGYYHEEYHGEEEFPNSYLLNFYHIPPEGSSVTCYRAPRTEWGIDVIPLDALSPVVSYVKNRENSGSWADTVTGATVINIIDYSFILTPQFIQAPSLEWTFFIHSEDGAWCKFILSGEFDIGTMMFMGSPTIPFINRFHYCTKEPDQDAFPLLTISLGDTVRVNELWNSWNNGFFIPIAYDSASGKTLIQFEDTYSPDSDLKSRKSFHVISSGRK